MYKRLSILIALVSLALLVDSCDWVTGSPDIDIVAPMDGETIAIGDQFTLEASVFDPDDSIQDLEITWSNGSDVIGYGPTLNLIAGADLQPGFWIIVATVIDPSGNESNDVISITIGTGTGSGSGNPTISIVRPDQNSVFSKNDIITFEAQIADDVDDISEMDVEWFNENISIGTGMIISVNALTDLGIGLHTIEAVVTDSTGIEATASVDLEISDSITGGIIIEF